MEVSESLHGCGNYPRKWTDVASQRPFSVPARTLEWRLPRRFFLPSGDLSRLLLVLLADRLSASFELVRFARSDRPDLCKQRRFKGGVQPIPY